MQLRLARGSSLRALLSELLLETVEEGAAGPGLRTQLLTKLAVLLEAGFRGLPGARDVRLPHLRVELRGRGGVFRRLRW